MERMDRLLEDMRATFVSIPGWRKALAQFRLKNRPPSWMRRGDDLAEVYRSQGMLLRCGNISWGALVQANTLLFEPGPNDHPALAIYSTDPFFDDAPDRLIAIAQRLYSLKGKTPDDPGDRQLAELVTNEMDRRMGWGIPKSCTGGREVKSATFMVFRRHIPNGILAHGWFPLLTHPDTPAVMILPSRYWPDEFARIWEASEPA